MVATHKQANKNKEDNKIGNRIINYFCYVKSKKSYNKQ